MKKKIFTLLLAIVVGIGSMFASKIQVDGIWYEFYSNTATVTYESYSFYSHKYSGNVVIPESVTYNGITYSVTCIGNRAFYECSGLTSVTIPNSVKNIGSNAFCSCTGLTSITIPNSVIYIEDGAFSYCTGLTSVTIPNSVTSIGDYAFDFCSNLTSVTIGNSVTSIGKRAFYRCRGLTSVTIGNNVTSIGTDAFYNCTSLTSVTIPNSVTSIGEWAFGDCSGLTSVTIGNGVTSIGNNAFNHCSGLISVEIPNNVTSIGDSVFYECSSMTSVTIGNSVTSIGEYAFLDCSGLTSVTIGNSVTSIGSNAFNKCRGLTSVTINSQAIVGKTYKYDSNLQTIFGSQVTEYIIGDDVTSIGDYAFYGCSSLTSVTIPNSVMSIGRRAFYGCTDLTSVTIPNNVTSIGNYAFRDCNGLTSITIPNSVTSIEDGAFYECRGLTSVTIGNSVTSIGDYAFTRCSGLISVTIGSSVTNIGEYAFSGCTGLTSVVWNVKNHPDFNSNNTPFYADYYLNGGYDHVQFDLRSQITSFTFGYEVEHIPAYLCKGMINLTSVTIEAETPPSLGSDAFSNTKNCPIYVPCSSIDVYKNRWPDYASRIYGHGTCESYTILFKNWDGTILQSKTAYKDETPNYTGTTPTRPDDEHYSYAFSGWSPQIVAATADATYTAQFTTTNLYTIVFKNWDGTVLQSKKVKNGQTPQYTGETPTRPYDEQYSYTFSGWSPKIVAATADATYTAQFRAEEFTCNDVQDTWLQTGGSGLGSMTTTNSEVWSYNSQYGAVGKKQGGATGWLLTPTKDLRGMKSVTLSFSHTHKFATNYTNEMTLWVCDNYNGDVDDSTWKQLTISPYASNSNWTFVNVNINVPLDYVGKKTVFGFKYVSTASNYATWEIKNLQLVAECAGTTPPDTLGHADVTTVSEVTATPNEDNSVTLTWPAVNGAETYTIEIKKNGDLICTLVFNANGQLISMNFAAPARNGKGRNIPAAEQSANGWEYVITGLEGNASYTYSFTAMGTNGNVLLNQSVNFSTGSSQGIDDVQWDNAQCTKLLRDGQIFILRGDKTYTLQGQEVK